MKNHIKQLAVPFKTHADFECILKRVKSNEKMILDTLKNIKHIFLTIFLTKLFVLTINLVKKSCSYQRKKPSK